MQNIAQPQRSWAAYATALGGLAAASASSSAGAAVLYTDIADVTASTVTDALYIDLDGGSTQLNGSTPSGADFFLRGTGASDVFTMVGFAGNEMAGYYLSKLSSGATIDSSSPWSAGPATYFEFWGSGNWQGGGDGYVGLRLNAGSGNFKYGWIHIDYDDAANTVTLKDFAVQTTLNTAISAGEVGAVSSVPEPSSALMLALGLGGVALRRRRQVAQQAAQQA